MLKKIIIPLLLILISLLYFKISYDPLKGHLILWRVKINTDKFILTAFTKDKNPAISTETLTAKGSDTFLRISKITTQDHAKLIKDRQFLLQSLYIPTTSPYPEVITNIIECPEEFKPKSDSIPNGAIYTLFAGERFNYGICAKDLMKYFSRYGIFDCKTSGVFEVSLFSQSEHNLDSIIKSFSC